MSETQTSPKNKGNNRRSLFSFGNNSSSSTNTRPISQIPPPAYSPTSLQDPVGSRDSSGEDESPSPTAYDDLEVSGPGADSRAKVDKDGRIDFWFDIKGDLKDRFLDVDIPEDHAPTVKEYAVDAEGECPSLNVVIFLVGSRGDVQPYISLALKLIETNGHTVRIATHGEFKDFVLNANRQLEGKVSKTGESLVGKLLFFDAGGDPRELMSYMVKNPGLLPGWESLTNGDVKAKQQMTATLLRGFYHSTYFPDPITGELFGADAIISNPPAFAHIHVAEALGLPLLMSFTMPWTPTTAYGHPLVNVRSSNAQPGMTNYIGYALADQLMWQGLGGIINKFRKKVLKLDELNVSQGPGLLDMLKIPWTYCWSQSLLPMPVDWKEHIDISGFYFFGDGKAYTPPDDIVTFLEGGSPPVYIGFGSVPVQEPEVVTQTIYDVVRQTGVRVIISSGWAGLGKEGVPEDLTRSVYILTKDCPHDWLFANGRLSAVCHHGGAGTTAIGLLNGLPTIIVPFFGDQKFWADAIFRAGAGPAPISPKKFTVDNLSKAIEVALHPEVKDKAGLIGETMRNEEGEKKGVASFHRHLPLLNMRCDVDPTRVALWWHKDYMIKLSGAVALHLVNAGKIDMKKLVPHRTREYETEVSNAEPLLASAHGVLAMTTYSMKSFGQLFTSPKKGVINTFYGIPKAAWIFFEDFYDAFDNVPRLTGTNVRRKGKVDGIVSGTMEGVAGLFLGLYDGFTGLVTEPMQGHKEEGAKGAVKGVGRSLLNLMTMPTSGLMGFFIHPSRGAARSIRRWMNSSEHVLHAPRLARSQAEAKKLTPMEKDSIWYKFSELSNPAAVEGRKKWFTKQIGRWTKGDTQAFDTGFDQIGQQTPSVSGPGSRRPSTQDSFENEAEISAAASEGSEAGRQGEMISLPSSPLALNLESGDDTKRKGLGRDHLMYLPKTELGSGSSKIGTSITDAPVPSYTESPTSTSVISPTGSMNLPQSDVISPAEANPENRLSNLSINSRSSFNIDKDLPPPPHSSTRKGSIDRRQNSRESDDGSITNPAIHEFLYQQRKADRLARRGSAA